MYNIPQLKRLIYRINAVLKLIIAPMYICTCMRPWMIDGKTYLDYLLLGYLKGVPVFNMIYVFYNNNV